MIDEEIVTHVVNRIVEHFHPNRVVAFGSYARGEMGPDSDLDLFIEMETSRRPPERAIEVSRLFGLRPWPMDFVVYTPAEVQRLRRVHGSFINTIEAEGKVLYERDPSHPVILSEAKDHAVTGK